MGATTRRRTFELLCAMALGIAVVGMIVYAMLPKPVGVDLGEVERGLLQVTVDEDGRTRIRAQSARTVGTEQRLGCRERGEYLFELNADGTEVLDGNGQPVPTYDNGDIREMAKTGVDIISIGALTHSAPAMDLSMDIIPSLQKRKKKKTRKD